MGRKTLNAYSAAAAGQGEEISQHIPVMQTLRGALRATEKIDTDLIDEWGPVDRMDEGVTAVTPGSIEGTMKELVELIDKHGQQVPILLRPSRKKSDRFDIIYGRRRLQACRELGIQVKANIQDMDDAEALMAKGLENAGRRNLSFYEKALFAEEITSQEQTATEVAAILGVNRVAVQQFHKVTRAIPRNVGVQIGAAPGAGRPKWHKLAEAFEAKATSEEQATELLDQMDGLTSDQRLDRLLKEISKRGAQSRVAKERSPVKGVKIKTGQGVRLSVQKGPFADWLDQNLDELLRKAHEDFEATGKEE